MLGYARSANVPAASFTAALPVLATVARRRLAGQLPPGFHRLWGLPLLDQLPTPAALDLAEAAALSGADAAVDAAAWQPGLLQWLRSAAPASAAGSLVAVVAAVLRLPPDIGGAGSGGGSGGGSSWGSGTSAEDAPSLSRLSADADCSWWQWWQEDAALSAQLAGLIRGASQPGVAGWGCLPGHAMPLMLCSALERRCQQQSMRCSALDVAPQASC